MERLSPWRASLCVCHSRGKMISKKYLIALSDLPLVVKDEIPKMKKLSVA